uniref:Putative sigma-70 region domain containing protein n=1 Tax=viral metagenome TaxID=1070528 RepID=A0A6M3KG32_9ZZZZ
MLSIGSEALLKALSKRDYNKPEPAFILFAKLKIKGALIDEIRNICPLKRNLLKKELPTIIPIDGMEDPDHSLILKNFNDETESNEFKEYILSKLNKREKYIVEERIKGRKQKEIGMDLELTESRISQILKEIKRRIYMIDEPEKTCKRGEECIVGNIPQPISHFNQKDSTCKKCRYNDVKERAKLEKLQISPQISNKESECVKTIKELKIQLDFTNRNDLYDKIDKKAQEEERTIESQIIFWIKNIVDDSVRLIPEDLYNEIVKIAVGKDLYAKEK